MKKTAMDYVTEEVEYARPIFVFPDLTSQEGNPREYFRMAKEKLIANGFLLEAKELENLTMSPYEQHFNIISKFLDFNKTKEIKEDEEFIYVKIRKQNLNENTRQHPLFSINSPEEIKELIDSGHDFSIKNCYDRTHLHYLKNPESIKMLLEANKEKEWFYLFDLDNFNATYLHNKNIKSFGIILEEMVKESPKMANHFLLGNDILDRNGFSFFLKECDKLFVNLRQMPEEELLKDFGKVLNLLQKINPNKSDEILNAFDILASKKNNPLFLEIKSKIVVHILEDTLLENNEDTVKPTAKKMKI